MPDLNMPVLIVDDQQPMRRTIADIMRSFGFRNLFYAEDGLMAWRQLEETPGVGLVLLDWSMPRMTGIELLKKMRESQDYRDIPVLMITAEAEKDKVVEAIESGVTNYIVKPFTPATLDKKLKQVFAARKPKDEPVKPFTPPQA
jgi:two-component system chemotaxis response regulator CheY